MLLVWLFLSHPAGAQILVRLRPDPVVHQREVRLADVAAIQAPTPQIAAVIGRADVATIGPTETSVVLKKSYARIRLMLAGWQSSLVVDGPESIIVTYAPPKPLTDIDVEQAAEDMMQNILGAEDGEIRVRLTAPFVQTLPQDVREMSGLRIDVLPPLKAQPGQTSMMVRLWKDETQITVRTARFDVLKRQRVAVTRISLQREKAIGPGDIQFENRFLPVTADEPAEEDVLGMQPRTSLAAGQVLSMRDLNRPTAGRQEVAVRTRDKVTATVVNGSLRVQLSRAEALQQGHVGDTINVRNIDSGKIFAARVVGAGNVEIRLR